MSLFGNNRTTAPFLKKYLGYSLGGSFTINMASSFMLINAVCCWGEFIGMVIQDSVALSESNSRMFLM